MHEYAPDTHVHEKPGPPQPEPAAHGAPSSQAGAEPSTAVPESVPPEQTYSPPSHVHEKPGPPQPEPAEQATPASHVPASGVPPAMQT